MVTFLHDFCGWCNAIRSGERGDCPFHADVSPLDDAERIRRIEVDYFKLLKEIASRHIEQGPGFYVEGDKRAELIKRLQNEDLTPSGRPGKYFLGIDPGHPTGMVTYRQGLDGQVYIDRPDNWATTLPSYIERDVEATQHMHKAMEEFYTPREEEQEMNRLDVVEEEIKRLQRERAILSRFPKDNFGDGTVIKFERVFNGSWEDAARGESGNVVGAYSFAAIKIGGRHWYLTGSGDVQQRLMTWNKLVEWLGDSVGKLWLCVEVADLLDPATDLLSKATRPVEEVVVTTEPPKEAEADSNQDNTWRDEATGLMSGSISDDLPGDGVTKE